jgi:hypothetical protein
VSCPPFRHPVREPNTWPDQSDPVLALSTGSNRVLEPVV